MTTVTTEFMFVRFDSFRISDWNRHRIHPQIGHTRGKQACFRVLWSRYVRSTSHDKVRLCLICYPTFSAQICPFFSVEYVVPTNAKREGFPNTSQLARLREKIDSKRRSEPRPKSLALEREQNVMHTWKGDEKFMSRK